jgi:hypothetical protein
MILIFSIGSLHCSCNEPFILVANIRRRVSAFWQGTKSFFQNLNLFPSAPPTTDEYELRNERISTRLFIILLTIILTVLLLYTSLATVTKTVNVETPTLAQYSKLYATYPQTLTCPCTTISINYGKFLHVEYSFHQVCSSVFVTENWISYLAAANAHKSLYTDDFRASGTFTFQALSAFCDLINRTISDSLTVFYSSQYVSAYVTPSELFQSQAQSLFLQFISTTTNEFLLSVDMIRDITQSNALLSGLFSNYVVSLPGGHVDTFTYPKDYGDCTCSFSAKCVEQFSIYNNVTVDYIVLFTVPGLYFGCYFVESLFQSTLECFYNQTCIRELQSYLLLSSSMNLTALDSSLPSQYFINSTIEELLDHLMVEQWNSSQFYDNYYNECQPAQCTYTHQAKNGIIYIVTALIGLLGGLITVLKLIVPRLVKFIRNKIGLRRLENGKIIEKLFCKVKLSVHVRIPTIFKRKEKFMQFR